MTADIQARILGERPDPEPPEPRGAEAYFALLRDKLGPVPARARNVGVLNRQQLQDRAREMAAESRAAGGLPLRKVLHVIGRDENGGYVFDQAPDSTTQAEEGITQ